MGGFLIFQFWYGSMFAKERLLENLHAKAQSYFDLFVDVRHWNASLGGVYAREKADLAPNPYLPHNILRTEHGEKLIRINPAWMTRQLAEIVNRRNHIYVHISSLKPVNPLNTPDSFEREALSFFEVNRNEESFSRLDLERHRYDYMGRLLVSQSCLQCHAQQGYKIGDIRGGIRVSISTRQYETIRQSVIRRQSLVIGVVVIFVLILVTVFYWLIFQRPPEETTDPDSREGRAIEQALQDRALRSDRLEKLMKNGRKRDA
jgi:hypothetical protein